VYSSLTAPVFYFKFDGGVFKPVQAKNLYQFLLVYTLFFCIMIIGFHLRLPEVDESSVSPCSVHSDTQKLIGVDKFLH
jgi:hypothetical protein